LCRVESRQLHSREGLKITDSKEEKIKRKLKEAIIREVDESKEVWRKVAFYNDPRVQEILKHLYDRWEKANRKGIPLDYATLDELRILHSVAMGKARTATRESWVRELYEREILGIRKKSKEEREESPLSIFKSIIRRLLIGGR